MWAKHTKTGFTIVELLIVIVVIGILAAIVIIAYNGIQTKAKVTSLVSDLTSARIQLGIDNATLGSYPLSMTASNGGQGLKASPDTTYLYGGVGSGFCLTATNGSISYVVTDTAAPQAGSCNGLYASYYPNISLSGLPTIERIESTANYNWGGLSPIAGVPATNFSVQWAGYVIAPTTGTYTFAVTSDDGERLYVNSILLVDKWVAQSSTTWTGTISLTAGQKVPITYQMYQVSGGSTAVLQWTIPGGSQTVIPSSALSIN